MFAHCLGSDGNNRYSGMDNYGFGDKNVSVILASFVGDDCGNSGKIDCKKVICGGERR